MIPCINEHDTRHDIFDNTNIEFENSSYFGLDKMRKQKAGQKKCKTWMKHTLQV